MSLKILSANCRSLEGHEKRKEVFDYLKEMNYDIYCLQETRFVSDMEKTVKKDWGGDCFFSCSGSGSRGVAILFRKAFAVENIKKDTDGNYLLLQFTTEEKKSSYFVVYMVLAEMTNQAKLFLNIFRNVLRSLIVKISYYVEISTRH